ncbi:hypothetical protein Shyhy01_21760 [Streptomyces hygroscopicus subsp. hygroscopicus]|nr:maleylpyruvate isomerase N-terminal domain-containing protein [Streptomyces hygroscopicus]GLX49226.1 hypothetical protein Shyhy01_21760 [Streptomyces hygroscopicus subsp. hygroscopicus]
MKLSERSGLDTGPEVVREALFVLRRRMVNRLEKVKPEQWSAPTRCAEWSVQDVVRHLVDFGRYDIARLTGSRELAFYEEQVFVPSRTPTAWLTRSAGQTPKETFAALARLGHEEYVSFGARIGRDDTDLSGAVPQRQVHWSVRSLHVLWDAWLHERDLATVCGPAEPEDTDLFRLVIAYGLLLAAAVAVRTGPLPHATVLLAGAPDAAYRIGGDLWNVEVETLTAQDAATADGPRLAGTVHVVLDSLAGRGAPLAAVLSGPAPVLDRLMQFPRLMDPETFLSADDMGCGILPSCGCGSHAVATCS